MSFVECVLAIFFSHPKRKRGQSTFNEALDVEEQGSVTLQMLADASAWLLNALAAIYVWRLKQLEVGPVNGAMAPATIRSGRS